jgi:NAD(P)-dependent dehydrogenase (short-subunit alcohol dehydrogenase family)
MTGGVWRLPERVAQLKKTVPLGRAAEPREIGDVACFLLSDDASYLNGQVVAVDGGSTAQ